MKGIKALGAAMLALLALGSLSATAASAHTWDINGSSPSFAEPMKASGTLTFSATYLLSYSCPVYMEGKVGPGAAGEITSVTNKVGGSPILCTVLSGGLGGWETVEVKAIGLPWKTEIASVGGELRDRILGSGSGWEVFEHREGHANQTLVCRGETNTLMQNVPSSFGVEAIYNAKSPSQSCNSPEGGQALKTTGSELVTSPTGTLSVS